MNLNSLKELYTNSPAFLKKIYSLIPFNLRNGGEYRKWRKHLKAENTFDRDPFETFTYAQKHFQFYKNLYRNIKIEKWEDIPLIEKSQIQSSLSEFEKVNIPKFYVTTGGVTGKPAKFYQSNNVWFKELAYVYNYFEKHGYKPNLVKASFRGGDFSALKKDIYWKSNPNYNEIHFSPFHLNIENISIYVEKLNTEKPAFFHGYPSSFITLAKLMQRKNLRLNYNPTCFFLISEGFKKHDVEFLNNFFNCKISSFYGHSERLIFAEADKNLETYKPSQDYGFMELIDNNGKVINENNKLGELVATSYDNFAMPLIRYKTGDYTFYTDFKTKTFGQIKGKWGQMSLTGYHNEEITLTALNLHSEELNSIQKVQFIQKDHGQVIMNVMFSEKISDERIQIIENLLSQRVGNLIIFKINVTDNFILNSRGKTPLIINELI